MHQSVPTVRPVQLLPSKAANGTSEPRSVRKAARHKEKRRVKARLSKAAAGSSSPPGGKGCGGNDARRPPAPLAEAGARHPVESVAGHCILSSYVVQGKLRFERNAPPRLPLPETPDSARLRAAASEKAMRQKNHCVRHTIKASEEHERRQVPESPPRTPRCR